MGKRAIDAPVGAGITAFGRIRPTEGLDPAPRCLAQMSSMRYKDIMGVSLTIRLDDETAMVLEREARRTNRSKGRIIRDAIRTYAQTAEPSALDGLAKYVGVMNGPVDLSTNKRYLESLGKPRRSR
jgi:hypothetical protein